MSNKSAFHAFEESMPMLTALRGAVAALNTAPAFPVRSLGAKVTSYDVVRHLEHAVKRAEALLHAGEAVVANWERGDLAGAVCELDGCVDSAKHEGGA